MPKPTPTDFLVQGVNNAGAEVLKANADAGSIKLLCRVRNKRAWCDIIEFVLARKQNWEAHICQQYFLRGGKLVYGWNVILQAEDVAAAAKNARDLFIKATEVLSQLSAEQDASPIESFPLVGASPNRNRPMVRDPRTGLPSHRGAYSIRGVE